MCRNIRFSVLSPLHVAWLYVDFADPVVSWSDCDSSNMSEDTGNGMLYLHSLMLNSDE